MEIRAFVSDDYDKWLPLWDGNNMGHHNEKVTKTTWQRLLDENSGVGGLGAFENGKMTGFLHFILHPVTGHISPACYMQDLFVDPASRQKGIGRKLVEALADKGKKEEWARVYWLAEADNEAAQALYKNIGVKLNFSLHILPL